METGCRAQPIFCKNKRASYLWDDEQIMERYFDETLNGNYKEAYECDNKEAETDCFCLENLPTFDEVKKYN